MVTNEVYERLAFDGEHVPIAGFPGMRERTVRISSAGKTFAFTGWKIGWVTATQLVTAVKTVKQFLTFVSGGPFQYAIAQALALPDAYYDTLRADLQAQRDLLTAGLAKLGFEVYPPRARTSSSPTSAPWASGTAWSSAAPCPNAPASSPSPPPSSTTTRRRPQPRSDSPSANARRS